MDEALSFVSLDISGRPYCDYKVKFKKQQPGFDVDLLEDFFRALSSNLRMTLHIRILKGRSTHHIIESIFKAFAKAISQAVQIKKGKGTPSTKGRL